MRSRSEEDSGGSYSLSRLSGCIADGDTPEAGEEAFSGKWSQRAPKSLHATLIRRAASEGVSFNTLCVALLAEGVGRREKEKGIQTEYRAMRDTTRQVRDLNRQGLLAEKDGSLSRAINFFRTALKTDRNHKGSWLHLGCVLQSIGRHLDAIEAFDRALKIDPHYYTAIDNRLLSHLYSSAHSARTIADAHRAAGRRYPAGVDLRRRPSSSGPLRIGYVSADFRRHPVGSFFAALLPHHDPEAVTVHAYYNHTDNDDLTERLRSAVAGWRPIHGVSDSEVAALIETDAIDVLIDAAGHTADNRLPLFAARAAPIQASWAGYPGTTGITTMDAFISDRLHVPANTEGDQTERVIALPRCAMPYMPPAGLPNPDAPIRALGETAFVCFNNPAKVSDQVVKMWGQILRHLPASHLLLGYRGMDDRANTERIRRLVQRQGAAPNQVHFVGTMPHIEILKRYAASDIALDTWPYSGGVTTLEALWMGVPVVTLPSDRIAGRHSLHHLTCIGRQEWIATDPDDYVRIAVNLARNLPQRAIARRTLRDSIRTSPLTDFAQFAADFETALSDLVLSSFVA